MADLEQQFMEVTGTTNREIASYYLEVTDKNIDQAVDLFLEDAKPNENTDSCSSETYVQHSKASAIDEQATVSKQALFLQWNVQGLLDTYLRERTVAIVQEIHKLSPDVVTMQEIVAPVLGYLQSSCKEYEIFCPPSEARAHYFAILMVRKATFQVSSKNVTKFASSRQGRNLITVSGTCCEQKMTVMTSHLESMKEHSSTRIQQFIQVATSMAARSSIETVIFGADTNMRDFEVKNAARTSNIVAEKIGDIWEMLGSPEDARYSWDLQKNDNQIKGGNARLRFGRVYLRSESESSKTHFKPKSMRFVGTQRLPCGMFPSDHWGILVQLEVP